MQTRNYYYYAVFWILRISDKRLWSYQGDKLLIWRKKIDDGRHDPNIFPHFRKKWCGLGINSCIQYVEHKMNWKGGFVDIRVTRYGWESTRRRRAAAGRNLTKTKSLPLVGGGGLIICYIANVNWWIRTATTNVCVTPPPNFWFGGTPYKRSKYVRPY